MFLEPRQVASAQLSQVASAQLKLKHTHPPSQCFEKQSQSCQSMPIHPLIVFLFERPFGGGGGPKKDPEPQTTPNEAPRAHRDYWSTRGALPRSRPSLAPLGRFWGTIRPAGQREVQREGTPLLCFLKVLLFSLEGIPLFAVLRGVQAKPEKRSIILGCPFFVLFCDKPACPFHLALDMDELQVSEHATAWRNRTLLPRPCSENLLVSKLSAFPRQTSETIFAAPS